MLGMVKLIHEIWEVTDDRGQMHPSLCLAGPDGEDFRKLLQEEALEDGRSPPRCVRRFEAGSHFEAMTIYYRHYGWGAYTTEFAWDREPYPDDWVQRQSSGTN
jgi:hypothetical protein